MPPAKSKQLTIEDYKYYLFYYLNLLWRFKFFIISIFSIVSILIFLALVNILSLTPQKSTGVLIGIDNTSDISAVEDVGDIGLNKFELIRSRNFLETIVNDLSLQLHLKKYPRHKVFNEVNVDSTAPHGYYDYKIDKKHLTFSIYFTNKRKGYKNHLIAEGPITKLNTTNLPGIYLLFSEKYLQEPFSFRFGVMDTRLAVDALLQNLRVSGFQGSNFSIKLAGTDYKLITKTVNRIADHFVETNLNFRKRRTQKISEVLQKQLDQAKQELDISKGALKRFMAANPTVRLNNNTERTTINDIISLESRSLSSDNILQTANNLQKRYSQSSGIEKQQTIREILSFLSSQQHPSAEVLSEEWDRLASQRESIETNYSTDHPFRKRHNEEIILKERRIVQALSETVKTISRSYSKQKESINALNEQLKSIPSKELRLIELERKHRIDMQLYSDIQNKYNEAKVSNAVEMADVYIMDYAIVPLPSSPLFKLIQLLIFSLGVGFATACAPVIALDLLKGTVRNTDDLKRKFPYPVIATLPTLLNKEGKGTKKKGNKYIPSEKVLSMGPSYISEIFRALRTKTIMELNASNSKVIAITSYSSGDGKSMIVSNLARMCAINNMRTLVIDLDLRCGDLEKAFGVPEAPGFSDLFLKQTLEERRTIIPSLIKKTDVANLSLLTTGIKPHNPQELLGSKVTGQTINDLKYYFDIIIIDCAPIGLTSDPVVLSQYIDKFIGVINANSTKISKFKSKMNEYKNVHNKMMGLILNRALEDRIVREFKKSSYYNYDYKTYANVKS